MKDFAGDMEGANGPMQGVAEYIEIPDGSTVRLVPPDRAEQDTKEDDEKLSTPKNKRGPFAVGLPKTVWGVTSIGVRTLPVRTPFLVR